MKKYIVQSDKKSLYEEFENIWDAKTFSDLHKCDCPYIEEVSFSNKYKDFLDDPNYETTIVLISDADIANQKYIDSYKNYCSSTYGDDYNLDEAILKEEYKNDGLCHVYLKYGCPPSQLKKILKQSIDNKESK